MRTSGWCDTRDCQKLADEKRIRLSSLAALFALSALLALAGARPVFAQTAQGETETPKRQEKQESTQEKPDRPAQPVTNRQEAVQNSSGPIFQKRPKVESDPQRPRRTVPINGVIGEGDWDAFYVNRDGPIKGTIYCNWDDNYLYLAARTDGAAVVIFDIDATNDGWLRSADNLEVVVGGITENGSTPSVVARLLDAANSKETPVWKPLVDEAKQIQVAGRLDGTKQVVTIAIPRNTGSLVLRPGATIGLRGEFVAPGEATDYVPTPPFEPHLLLEATLVEARTVSVPGLSPHLTLSDIKCVPGQKLFATLELYNQTDTPMPIKSVHWEGQGNSANAVNSVREVAIKPISPMKRDKLGYKTLLPPDLQIGSYTLNVTVELENGRLMHSSASFSVVEPLHPTMAVVPNPVTIVGPTTLNVVFDVANATPGQMNCDLELTSIPAGWELVEKRSKLPLTVEKKDARGARQFVFKLPSTTPPGDYTIEGSVTWHKRVWKLSTIAHVDRPDPVTPKREIK